MYGPLPPLQHASLWRGKFLDTENSPLPFIQYLILKEHGPRPTSKPH